MPFIHYMPLVFWRVSLLHFGCHLFGTSAARILGLWLTHIEAKKSLNQNKSSAFWMPSLCCFRWHLLSTSAANVLGLWLSNIKANSAVSKRQIRVPNIKIECQPFGSLTTICSSDTSFDYSFDSSFDSSFESSFESSFDSLSKPR